MPIAKFTTRWDGWTGAPGYSNFYVWGSPDGAQIDAAAAAIRTFFFAVRGALPSIVTLTCVPTVQIFSEGDGSLADQVNITTTPAAVAGSGSGNFSAASGICVSWRTAQSTGRRLLLGRTFLVPCAAVAGFGPDGTVDTTMLSTVITAANTYVNRVPQGTNGRPVVWHRPKNGSGGLMANVTSATVTDKTAVLRSRRD